MCRKHRQHERATAYHGPTVHLSEGHAVLEQRANQHCMRSPWHLLWLLWPLSMVGKWAIPIVAGVWTRVAASAAPWLLTPQTLLATLLIGCGLFLILRRARTDSYPYDE